jgi:hypothetical protein
MGRRSLRSLLTLTAFSLSLSSSQALLHVRWLGSLVPTLSPIPYPLSPIPYPLSPIPYRARVTLLKHTCTSVGVCAVRDLLMPYLEPSFFLRLLFRYNDTRVCVCVVFLWCVSVCMWCGKSGWLVREADSRSIAPRYRETQTETERIDRCRRRREGKWSEAERSARRATARYSHTTLQPQPHGCTL